MRERFLPGDPTLVASDSPTSAYSAVFEDDGDTGYFYAVERGAGNALEILDAVHVYDVRNVVDREIPSEVHVRWSADGLKAALLINEYPHAVIDFAAARAYSRTNFPPPGGRWRAESRDAWRDDLMRLFGDEPPRARL
jgi:hypothetical protein